MTTTTRTFEALYTEVTSDGCETVAHRVDAAYFAEEGRFTVFKDAGHKQVYAVRSDCLLSVERLTA